MPSSLRTVVVTSTTKKVIALVSPGSDVSRFTAGYEIYEEYVDNEVTPTNGPWYRHGESDYQTVPSP